MCGRVFNPYAMRSGASLSRCHDANVAIFPISRTPFGTIFFMVQPRRPLILLLAILRHDAVTRRRFVGSKP